MNPWGLTGREQEVIGAVSAQGSSKLAARQLGLSHRTVEIYLSNIRKKMGLAHTLLVALAWDRYVFARSAEHRAAE